MSAKDIANALQFEKALGASGAADLVLKKMKPEHLKLLAEIAKNNEGSKLQK